MPARGAGRSPFSQAEIPTWSSGSEYPIDRPLPDRECGAGATGRPSSLDITPMANTNTSNQRRLPGRKAADIEKVWREQAPEAVFRKVPLADYQAALGRLNDSNEELDRLARTRAAATQLRDEAEDAMRALSNTVIRGVEGHGDYGDDSPLYRAMGFVPKSQRSSGLTRRGGSAEASPGNKETAA